MGNLYKYIIVGGGLAGASAVEGIRQHDASGSIALIGKEGHLPYHRPPLSKGLWLGKTTLDKLPIHDAAFYESQRVALHLNTEVATIDPAQHHVTDTNGNRYQYEKLLLALGGTPRRLPIGEGTISYFRTVDDYSALREASERASSFVLIGGGFIGAELAAALAQQQKKVTLIFPANNLLNKVLPADLAEFVTGYYRDKGVTVVHGDSAKSIERQNDKIAVTTAAGRTFAADAVVAAVGLELPTAIAQKAGLRVDNGLVVDAQLRTSQPDVYGAGDLASFPAAALDKTVRVEHWDNAQVQGRYAGENMAGAARAYDYLPYFFSDLFDLGFEAVGELDSRMQTYADWREPYRKGVVYYLDTGRVKGVLLWNVWDTVEEARQLIVEKKVYPSMEALAGRL